MTMLIHTHGPLERPPRSSAGRKTVRTGLAAAHRATIKRFCLRALAIMAVMGALAGIVALEAAFYLSRLNY